MSEETKVPEENAAADEAVSIVETVQKLGDGLDGLKQEFTTELSKVKESLDEAKKVQYPYGPPNGGGFGIRKGEDPMNSEPYSLMKVAIALQQRKNHDDNWKRFCKNEFDLSNDLKKVYMASEGAPILAPLGTDLMPQQVISESGEKQPGVPQELIEKCRSMNNPAGVDWDEVNWLEKRGINLRKTLSANTATTGGTLVGFPAQGELIELLRAKEVFSQAGAVEISFPPQGSIRFPRETSSVTISGLAEGATVTASTPGTSHLLLQAKKYVGAVDIPEELLRFATSVTVENWLRTMMARDIGDKTDQDMINGAGGSGGIQGVVNYSAFRTVVATTVAANGNTLKAEDPSRLYADIADQNAPIDMGFFFAMRNTMWGAVTTRRADAVSAGDADGSFVFSTSTQAAGGGRTAKTLNGELVITSTNVPLNRAKGSGTTLTMVLGGVGPEWVIARSGVIEFAMTDSDASKFMTGISTMKGSVFCDAGPRHEQSFGMIDTLLNS